MTAAWRLVPSDPFRTRTRNPALALASLAHLALLGALAVSALLRVVEPPPVDIFPTTTVHIVLPPPPIEPPVPVLEQGRPYDVQIPRGPAPPPRGDSPETLPDLPDTGRGPDLGDVGSLPPGLGPVGVPGPGGPGTSGDREGPGVPDGIEDGDGPLPIGRGIAKPTLLHRVEPEYPTIARKSRLQGSVTVQAVIGHDGAVEDAEIVHSSNHLFDEAALDAVRQWRYAPATLNGRPVRVTFRVHVEFVLE